MSCSYFGNTSNAKVAANLKGVNPVHFCQLIMTSQEAKAQGRSPLSRLWFIGRRIVVRKNTALPFCLCGLAQFRESFSGSLRILLPIGLGVSASEREENLRLAGDHLRGSLEFLDRSFTLTHFDQ